MTNVDLPECVGKYVTSLIDGVTYCRKNGSLLRHIRQHNLEYESYYNKYYNPPVTCAHCSNIATFETKTMTYKYVCGAIQCRNIQISKSKNIRTKEQWDSQRIKFRQTMGQKTDSDIQSIVDHRIETYKKHNGIDHRLQKQVPPASLAKLQDKKWMIDQHITQRNTAVKIAEDLQVGVTTATNWLHRHDIDIQLYRSSQIERDIINELYSINPGIHIKPNDRSSIAPMELDILLPDYKLAFEINGIYWHGETKGKTKNYHLSKTIKCANIGIRLIHITDADWYTNRDVVRSRIKSYLGKLDSIMARKCIVRPVNVSEMKTFFNATHIQGYTNSGIGYGLEHDGHIVAMMSFGKARFKSKMEYELIRFSNRLNTSVVGGASKLFSHFIRQHCPTTIVSYSDNAWNTGNVYNKLGFVFSHDSTPNYRYFKTVKPLELFSRHGFQKHKLSKVLDTYNGECSEWENMQVNGYDRIWDCGNKVYHWINTSGQ